MKARTPRVMLIAESKEATSYLLCRLQTQGCECRFATSYEPVRWLLGEQVLDLVLGPPLCGDEEAVVAALAKAKATLFCFHTLDDRCWWVPVVRRGRPCSGTPALRPSEFIAVLDATVDEIKATSSAPLAVPA